ncbi:hypothetical protein HMPREF1624_08402 [Sporothrix schenckii ATCC 58251]|uniref:Enoyl reductase (ER) domain-containing protein n=1 Tax=Sporothrix schenckii (strain ATCC 58251 / de Perez 2211183) TaxID=1391915 RepID=U7PJT0_SPOS1|nr:hypothetical protein HMPREF1624_08402 [Sporothrix schenckii ATCC 58251]
MKAAVCTAAGTPLVVQDMAGPASPPDAGKVIIKTAAVAVNPFDAAMQTYGAAIFSFLKFPVVFGEDVAGVVEEVGAGAPFAVGDRVAGLSLRAGFQERVVLEAHMAYRVPAAVPFAAAASLPMGVMVAMFGLFHPTYLNLRTPSPTGPPPAPAAGSPEVVLIWGASTSVGSQAVQMAARAGYEVITTASPARFAAAKALGAAHVFDYGSPTVVDDIKAAAAGKTVVGAFCNGGTQRAAFAGIIAACADVVRGQARPFLALTMVMPPGGVPAGVEGKFVEGVHDDPAFTQSFLGTDGFLPRALEAGTYQVAPAPQIVGHGLEALQGGLDMVKAGVSATKVVVTL